MMDAVKSQELQDLLESMANKIAISLVLLFMNKHNLLPTILECLHEDSQKIIDGWCIKGEAAEIEAGESGIEDG